MFRDEIKKGTVELIVLALLEQRPMYGYEIIKHIESETSGAFIWREASLYPTLYRLEERGLLRSYWEKTEGRRPRKYYAIANQGRHELARQRKEWAVFSGFVNKLAGA